MKLTATLSKINFFNFGCCLIQDGKTRLPNSSTHIQCGQFNLEFFDRLMGIFRLEYCTTNNSIADPGEIYQPQAVRGGLLMRTEFHDTRSKANFYAQPSAEVTKRY